VEIGGICRCVLHRALFQREYALRLASMGYRNNDAGEKLIGASGSA
jgi:hypothetical protein